MPFRSERQRRYLWKFHPDIAKRWSDEYGSKPIKKKGGVKVKKKVKTLKFPADGKTMRKALTVKRKWTQAQDDAYDAKRGWKEGSKGDIKQDRLHGIKDKRKKTRKKKKNWIQNSIKHPGALRRTAGVKGNAKIPSGKLNQLAHRSGTTGRRARLAETLRSFHKGKKTKK